jgi:flagella basal body P-ring formation protein FlgA
VNKLKTFFYTVFQGKTMQAKARLAAWLWMLVVGVGSASAANLQEDLFASATTWVAAQTISGADLVKFAPLDPRIKVQECHSKIEFDFPFANKSTVRAKCNQPNWQLFIKVSNSLPINGVEAKQSAPSKQAMVAKQALVAGHILTANDLEAGVDTTSASGSFLDKDALIGRMLKRNLAKGQLLLAQDIENSLQVLKLKQNLRANELISFAAYERVTVGKDAIPVGVWLGAELPPGARLTRDMQAGQVLLSTDLAESRQVVFANTNMVAGQTLKAGSLRLEKLDQDKVSRTHLFELAGLDGFELTRTIRAGEALRTTDLRPALLVKRGEMVVLSIGRPTEFEITIKLEAMQDGRMGEQIKLKNAETGRILNGIVTGPGQLRGS